MIPVVAARARWALIARWVQWCGSVVLLSGLALAVTWWAAPFLGGISFSFSLVAVLIAALHGGMGAGLFATALCAGGYAFFLAEPTGSFAIARRVEVHRLVGFVSVALLASWVSGSLRSALASQRAQALDRARLAAQAEKARERAELLASLGAALNADQSLSEVLSTAVARGTRLLGGNGGCLCLANRGGRRLRCTCNIVPPDRPGALLDPAVFPHGRQAVERGGPVYYRSVEAGGVEPAWFQKLGMSAALAIPLVCQGSLIGILFVGYRQERFTERKEDEAFAKAITGLCAPAVTRAEAYRELTAGASKLARTPRAERPSRSSCLSGRRPARTRHDGFHLSPRKLAERAHAARPVDVQAPAAARGAPASLGGFQ